MRYIDIVEYIKNQVSLGNIKTGEKMPSIRDLCEKFKCTKSTAVRAYYELKNQNIVYAVPNSGYYLLDKLQEEVKNDTIIDFAGTALEISSLPYGEFQTFISKAIDKYKDKLFYYTNPQGLQSLIKVMQKQLQNNQVFSECENIFITTGSQQTLNILSRMPFPNGKNNVVIEQPTYDGMMKCLEQNNVTTIGVNRNFNGLDFERLENIFRNNNVKFFYTVSRFSNPLGLSYTKEEKKKLVSLAEKYDVYIVEDDYLGDIESDIKSDPIFSFDTSSKVVYVKTFSKVMLPGLRVAVTVLPSILCNTFLAYKTWMDINTPVLSQGALELYIESGMFNIHVKKIRDMYLSRMNYLKDIVGNNNSSAVKWHIPSNGGFYAGLEILNENKSRAVVNNLLKKNILVSNFERFYLNEFLESKLLRVSVANADYKKLEIGVDELIGEIEKVSIFNEYVFRG
ncbi:aminotransferase-like domain-containing protein [Clostridium hydrogenum]|uniref:aminotransferase-like domain-containing protein n=1 Tax=Clostridium hydrogenum TaxID=2855764 RepID=UPI001F1B5658|nr:PLP-dependent aminotransferase family protein [Clostridium hydrogenum]